MKKNLFIITVFGFLTALFSCEKVIEIDLDESDAKIVIEAELKEGTHLFSVNVSKTRPYFESGISEKLSGAVITLSDDQGNTYMIPETAEPGVYTENITGIPGRTYTLRVSLDDEVYEARSSLLVPIPINNLSSEFQPAFGPNESGYTVSIEYTDPAEIANFYRVMMTVNGVPRNAGSDLIVTNDDFNNGTTAELPLFGFVFEESDTIDLTLVHFDEASYDYYNSLADIVSSGMGPAGGAAAPGNPVTNWSGDILGYFSAVSSDTDQIIIQ